MGNLEWILQTDLIPEAAKSSAVALAWSWIGGTALLLILLIVTAFARTKTAITVFAAALLSFTGVVYGLLFWQDSIFGKRQDLWAQLVGVLPTALFFLMSLIASGAAIVSAWVSKTQSNPTPSVSPFTCTVEPVGFDTETGRPILRYDEETGKPIYLD